MKKSVVIGISVLLVVVMIVLIYFLIAGIGQPEEPGAPTPSPGPAEELVIPELDDVVADATSQDDVEECQKLNGVEITQCISEYYFNKFKETGDVSYCDEILINDMKSECVQWDSMKLNEAVEAQDESICEDIFDETIKLECLGGFGGGGEGGMPTE